MSGPQIVKRLKTMKPTSRLFCTRFFHLRKDALRASRWFERHGATSLTLVRVRVLLNDKWRVRCQIEVSLFAEFCALEAKRESTR